MWFCVSAQCLSLEGFCLFLKTYLEVEEFPPNFCEKLFRYFQHAEQNGSPKSSMPKGGNSLQYFKFFTVGRAIRRKRLQFMHD